MAAAVSDFSADREESLTGSRCEQRLPSRFGGQGQMQEDHEKQDSVEEVSQPWSSSSFILMTLCNPFPPHHATSIPKFDSCQAGHNSSSFFTTKRHIPESKRVRTMLYLLFPNCVSRCHRALQQTQGAPWDILNVLRELDFLWTSC